VRYLAGSQPNNFFGLLEPRNNLLQQFFINKSKLPTGESGKNGEYFQVDISVVFINFARQPALKDTQH